MATLNFSVEFLLALFISLGVNIASSTHDEVNPDHTVCYGHLGCFSVEPPFAPEMPLPSNPDKIHTKFLLHTRPNTTAAEILTADRETIQNSNFDPRKKTKIVVHGFVVVDVGISEWVTNLTQAILANDDANVIIVNWIGGARVAYDQAVSNTRLVGAQIAHLIRMFMDVHNSEPDDFHLIGFSLGAHVVGFAGKEIKKSHKNQLIGRITGLDPANPGFNYDSAAVRLDKSDAKFVDVIHTDTSTLLVVASGINRNIGHVDFYPNGGASQPGCNTWKSNSWISAVTDMTVCDHVRAPILFMNSINTTSDCAFAAYKCDSYEKFKTGRCMRCAGKRSKKGKNARCNQMGYWAKPPTTNKQIQYYLQTSDTAPFCAKHYQVMMHWRKGPGSTKAGFRAKLFVTLHGDKGSTKEYALNDGTSFIVVPGKTSRFMVSVDCKKDIGNVDRVTFRWERPTCYTWIFCPDENVYLKRMKIFDAMEQKRYSFFPLKLKNNAEDRNVVVEVSAGATEELFRKSFIRSKQPHRFSRRSKEPRDLAVPALVVAHQAAPIEQPQHGLLDRISKDKRNTKPRSPRLDQYLSEDPSAALTEST